MENNNLSGDKKREMITLKNGNKIKLENVVCAEVKVSSELAEKLNKISERLKNAPIIKAKSLIENTNPDYEIENGILIRKIDKNIPLKKASN